MELLENCSVLGNSPFPGDLEPGRTIRELGWLEFLEMLELLEMRPGTDWYQLPSSSSSSSSPAACHLADEGNPPSKNPPNAHKKQKGGENKQQPQCTYSAAAGSRPPNPSLVVDLAHMDFPDGSWPRPEIICEVLNKKLGEVTPPQSQLAAVVTHGLCVALSYRVW